MFRTLNIFCCCLLMPVLLLAACASVGGSSTSATTPSISITPTPSPKPSQAVTPTSAVPTISTTLLTYKGQAGPVIGVSWSPDDSLIASASQDGSVQIWKP